MQQDLSETSAPGGPDVQIPSYSEYRFSFDKERYGVDAGGSVTLNYTLPEDSRIELMVKDGWSAELIATDAKSGQIVVTCPDPAIASDVVVKAVTTEGSSVAQVLPLLVRDPYTDATRTDVAAMGYFCFYPDIATDYHFSKMAECGMNMLTIEAYDNWEEQLELSEKYGLKGVLFVNGAAGDYYFNQADTKLSEIIAVAKDMPALAGYQIFDEPSVKNIGQIKFEKDRIEELDPNPNHPVYVNLHPSSVSAGGMGVEDYFEYVERIVTECDLKFITFDQYPVFTSGIDPSWSRSLAAIYESSKRHNIPFWAFTLCCREHNREDPNVGNIRLQCNTNLAYGAQVNQFFVYRATSGTNYAPLMGDGTYTKAYDDCKTYCTEMHNRGYVFSGSDVKFLRHTNEAETYGCFLSERDYPDAVSAFSTSGPTLVSFVENKGNCYMVVVNKNWQEAINVDITFEDMVYVIDHDGEFTEFQKGDAHLSIEEGDMMVIKYR